MFTVAACIPSNEKAQPTKKVNSFFMGIWIKTNTPSLEMPERERE